MPEVQEYLMPYQPDWRKALSWAKYWAIQEDGRAMWFECQPNLYDNGWYTTLGVSKTAGYCDQAWAKQVWRYTLVDRNGKLYKVPFNPEWAKAPAWAKYWAANFDGSAWWYGYKPDLMGSAWTRSTAPECKSERAGWVNIVWAREHYANSLFQRPAMVEYQPEWDKAPTWARYCSVDAAGRVHWHQHKPDPVTNRADDRYWSAKYGQWDHYEDIEAPGTFGLDWTTMVYKRPLPLLGEYDPAKDKVTFLIDASQDHLSKIRALFVDLERETQARDAEILELRTDLAEALRGQDGESGLRQQIDALNARTLRAQALARTQEKAKDVLLAAQTKVLKQAEDDMAEAQRSLELKDGVINALNLTILDLQNNLRGAQARADESDESARRNRESNEKLRQQIASEDALAVVDPLTGKMTTLDLLRKKIQDGAV